MATMYKILKKGADKSVFLPVDKIPNSHDSQGAFPFGTRCAIKQLHETIKSLKN